MNCVGGIRLVRGRDFCPEGNAEDVGFDGFDLHVELSDCDGMDVSREAATALE